MIPRSSLDLEVRPVESDTEVGDDFEHVVCCKFPPMKSFCGSRVEQVEPAAGTVEDVTCTMCHEMAIDATHTGICPVIRSGCVAYE